MRSLLVFALLCGALFQAVALGRVVEPNGKSWAFGEVAADGGRTLIFSPNAIPERSWLLLPARAVVHEVEYAGKGLHRLLAFPVVPIPGLRYAFEVPAHVLSVTLRGRVPTNLTLVRTAQAPPLGGWVARSRSELRVDLPPWKTAEGWTPYLELRRPVEAPWQALVTNGRENQTFSFRASVLRWDYAPGAWGLTPTAVVVRGADPRLSEVRVRAVEAMAPRPADPATLLSWPMSDWRNPRREWFHWAGTSVLVLVTADYRTQDDYLKRLAFYVEKEGFRGRLWDDSSIAAFHAWNAHDYAAPDLARFYNQAAREHFPLNGAELELRDRLVRFGILVVAKDESWTAGTGALIGVSVESAPTLRSTLFVHEAFHGLYFTTPAFRSGVKKAWDTLSEAAREQFRSYLSRSRYDPSDEGLMVNEFQAYVLQRQEDEWEGFFRERVLASRTQARARVELLVEYLAASRTLDTLVQNLFGTPSGKVSPVTAF